MDRLRRITMTRWEGDHPEPGDLLQSSAGTRYFVHEVRPGRVNPFTLMVVRLAPDAVVEGDGRTFEFVWNKRQRRAA